MLKPILEDMCNRCLSLTDFPSILPMPDEGGAQSKTQRKKVGGVAGSARKSTGSASRWSAGTSKKAAAGPAHLSGPRIIVFIVGGASFAELRTCRDITDQEGREVILGSTAFVSASSSPYRAPAAI